MTKVRVPIFGAPLKSVVFDSNATNGATVGTNLFAPDGSVVRWDQILNTSSTSSSTTTTFNGTADDIPQGQFNLYVNFASPSAAVGLSAVVGTATTAMRSDAAPPIDQTISPTWTGTHTFTQTVAGVDPTAANQLATKNYVDQLAQGNAWKAPVLCATTANITLSGLQTIDGISVTAGARVLVVAQTTAANNGIYIAATGAWSRSLDMDVWAEVPNASCFVEEGTVNADKAFVCTSDPGGTLGTTAITFVVFNSTTAGVVSFNGRSGVVAPQSGDYTFSLIGGTIAFSQLPASGVTAGTYGDSTHYPVVTVDTAGRVTNVTLQTSGGGSGGATNITPDTHPSVTNAANDEFEAGSSMDTSGGRFSGATPWTAFGTLHGTWNLSQGSSFFQALYSGGVAYEGYSQPTPGTTPWVYTAKMACHQITGSSVMGLLVGTSSGGAGKFIAFGFNLNASTLGLVAQHWNNVNSYVSNVYSLASFTSYMLVSAIGNATESFYLRVSFDGTTLTFSISFTGVEGTFYVVYTETAASFLGTVGTIGIGGQQSASTTQPPALITDWFRRTT